MINQLLEYVTFKKRINCLTVFLSLFFTPKHCFFCSEWKHTTEKNISVATAKNQQIVAAVGKEVFYIEIGDEKLEQIR